MVRARRHARGVERQHAPRHPFELLVARERGELPHHAHREEVLEDRGEVDQPRGDAQRVGGLGMQRDGQPAEQVGRQVAQAEEQRAVLLQPELRPGEGRRVDSDREDAGRDRLRFREALLTHGLELARVEGAGEAEAEEEVGRCEQRLRAAVQPVHVRQRRGVGALGDDASDDGGDDEE